MGAWRRWAAVLGCAAIVLLVPIHAIAKPGYVSLPGSHEAELQLKGSHGYMIEISKFGQRGIQLYANQGSSVVVYVVPNARSGDDGMEAEFPGVGRISVRFHPTGKADKKPGFFPPCKGGQTIEQKGYFQGVIRIRGERGYTVARARRAPGRVVTRAKEICKRSLFDPDEPSEEESEVRLFAASRSTGRTVSFSAVTLGFLSNSVTFFTGASGERREGMAIYRQVLVRASEKDFASDTGNYPSTASVTPPQPFQGSATFGRGHDGMNSWTGSLALDLPGIGRVNMAGAKFDAKLCKDSGCRPGRSQFVAGRLTRSLPRP